MKQHHAKGHTHKHTSTAKHSGTKKHNPGKQHQGHGKKGPKTSPGPLVVAKHPKHQKARKLAEPPVRPGITPFASRGRLDGPGASLADWDACTAIALGASLRLAGWPVGDQDVLALHVAAGGGRDVGVSILAALDTAARVGLAGVRPRSWESVPAELIGAGAPVRGWEVRADRPAVTRSFRATGSHTVRHARPDQRNAVILGVELPGPHALAVDGGGVWSWGEWHPWECFGGAVAEEAWQVTWP
jgi:hypothetical protein